MKMIGRISVNQVGDDTCIKVYDPERQKLIAVFETYKKTAAKLGITDSVVMHTCSKRGKTYSPVIGKKVALRLSAIKEGDRERILYCNKQTILYEKTEKP